nr:DDE-type integrase/transposase/recombinase [Rhodococcus qingshengii]
MCGSTRPWVTEPGMWLQYDYGDGPVVDGVKTVLFVAWLAWSRFRVVIALRDKTMPSVFAALDQTFRRLGGVPTYVLTDNEKTVTTEHIAGIPSATDSSSPSPSTTRSWSTPVCRRIRRPRAAPSRR